MEAMWTALSSEYGRDSQTFAAGVLGEVRTVTADCGVRFAKDSGVRLFAPLLGGGALLDLGVYPVSFSSMVLGTPTKITAVSDPAFTGVDAQTSIILRSRVVAMPY